MFQAGQESLDFITHVDGTSLTQDYLLHAPSASTSSGPTNIHLCDGLISDVEYLLSCSTDSLFSIKTTDEIFEEGASSHFVKKMFMSCRDEAEKLLRQGMTDEELNLPKL